MYSVREPDELCKKSDDEIIWQSLMARCRQLERTIKHGRMTEKERLQKIDEYERTFELTGRYSRR